MILILVFLKSLLLAVCIIILISVTLFILLKLFTVATHVPEKVTLNAPEVTTLVSKVTEKQDVKGI